LSVEIDGVDTGRELAVAVHIDEAVGAAIGAKEARVQCIDAAVDVGDEYAVPAHEVPVVEQTAPYAARLGDDVRFIERIVGECWAHEARGARVIDDRDVGVREQSCEPDVGRACLVAVADVHESIADAREAHARFLERSDRRR
jgi:hypothetical protein